MLAARFLLALLLALVVGSPATGQGARELSIEAIFAEAVQQAFRPALKEWVDDHSNDIMDQLRPLIRAWMDEHLPPLIEAAVIKEISRAAMRKP